MKNRIIVLAIIAGAALAACGGGGGSAPVSPGTTGPTVAPAPYHITLTYTGAMAPRAVSGSQRSPKDVASATPIPIAIVEPDAAGFTRGLNFSTIGSAGSNVIATAAVAPAPSASPQWSTTAQHVEVNENTNPGPSPSPGVFQKFIAADAPSVVAVSGVLNVSVDTVTQATPIYVYKRVTLGCDPNYASLGVAQQESRGGVKFSGGTPNYVDDPANADLYITGPICPGLFHSAEADITFHYPGGGVYVSDTTPFNTITAAAWSNAGISNTTASMTDNGATNNLIVIHTRDLAPSTVVIKWNNMAAGARPGTPTSAAQFSGGFKQCGFAVDGSC